MIQIYKLPQILIATILLASPLTTFGRQPSSPLYRFQFWAKNHGGLLKIEDPSIASRNHQTLKTCSGIDLNLEPAWNITTGSQDIVVAVIDDGFSYDHPNLKPNIDPRGYNFADPGKNPDSCIWDIDAYGKRTLSCGYWHGNMALGIIGAKPNSNFGIAGINWQVSMMLLKISNQNGVGASHAGRAEHIAEAIRYATDHGARIINWSGFLEHSTVTEQQLVSEAIHYAKQKGLLIVISAGNGRVDMDANRDKLPFPMNSDFENVVYVANIDACGALVDFEKNPDHTVAGKKRMGGSNFGTRAFIAAPAEYGITVMNDENGVPTYMLGGGTSNAAPMVTGVAALMLSVNPKLEYGELKEILCSSTRKLPALKGKTLCGGIADAGAAVALAKVRRPLTKLFQ